MGRQPRFRLAEGYAPESEKLFLQKHLSAWPQPEARLAEQPASPHVEVLGISRERRLQADLIGRRILIEEVRDAGPGAGPNRVTTRRLDLDSFEASQIAFLLGGRLDGMMPESSRITHTGMRRVVVRASDSPPGSACLWLAESENNVYSMGEGVQITLRPDELRVAADALRRLSDAARDAQKA
jgi:hypothetical protein